MYDQEILHMATSIATSTSREIIEFALTADRSRRLRQVADSRETSATAIVEMALDLYFSLYEPVDIETERQEWHRLYESSLQTVWDNDSDAAYDDWKTLYGVQNASGANPERIRAILAGKTQVDRL